MDLTLVSEFAQQRVRRKLKPEHWDATLHQAAPSSRTISGRRWQWRAFDWQHKVIPQSPANLVDFCRSLEQEIESWMQQIGTLSVDDLDSRGLQFSDPECRMDVHSLMGHMIQKVIDKHGQFPRLI